MITWSLNTKFHTWTKIDTHHIYNCRGQGTLSFWPSAHLSPRSCKTEKNNIVSQKNIVLQKRWSFRQIRNVLANRKETNGENSFCGQKRPNSCAPCFFRPWHCSFSLSGTTDDVVARKEIVNILTSPIGFDQFYNDGNGRCFFDCISSLVAMQKSSFTSQEAFQIFWQMTHDHLSPFFSSFLWHWKLVAKDQDIHTKLFEPWGAVQQSSNSQHLFCCWSHGSHLKGETQKNLCRDQYNEQKRNHWTFLFGFTTPSTFCVFQTKRVWTIFRVHTGNCKDVFLSSAAWDLSLNRPWIFVPLRTGAPSVKSFTTAARGVIATKQNYAPSKQLVYDLSNRALL